MTASLFSFRAHWVFPIIAPPIHRGVVTIDQVTQRIVRVGDRSEVGPVVDLGNSAIIPALVNAHTHLEFSDLPEPLGRPGIGFSDWIRCVIEHRRQRALAGDNVQTRSAATKQGLSESHLAGVTALGEIAPPGFSRSTYAEAEQQTVLFLELLGLGPEREAALLDLARNVIAVSPEQPATSKFQIPNPKSQFTLGLSPHAPYTVSPDLLQAACKLSRQHQAPLAMHLAESWDEMELLQSHSGPLVELLCDLGAWHPGVIPRGIEPRQYLEWLAEAYRALVIHGNFLQPDDWQFLAERRERMTLVHCPRTHAYFGRGQFPLRQILDAGVRVAVGTDSRASNPDLSVFAELQQLYLQHPDILGEEILKLGTIHAAESLGIERSGTLVPGAMGTVVRNCDESLADPYEFLFSAYTAARLGSISVPSPADGVVD